MTLLSKFSLPFDKIHGFTGFLLFLCILLVSGCQPPNLIPIEPLPPTHTLPPTPFTAAVKPSSTAPPVKKTLSPTPSQVTEITALPCTSKPGKVMGISLEDKNRMQILTIQVYLPPCYPSQENTTYPLLLLLHGQGYDQDHWLNLGLAETADHLITSDQIPAMIILMPLEEFAYQDPTQSNFDEMIIDFLLPWAVDTFSTCAQADCRAVGGISRGGAWALHMGSDYPEVFGGIGMHSAPPFPADQYRLMRVLRDLPESQRPKLFIDVGDIDTYRSFIIGFHEDLTEQGVAHTWNMDAGGHEDEYWRAHLEDYLLWYGSIFDSP